MKTIGGLGLQTTSLISQANHPRGFFQNYPQHDLQKTSLSQEQKTQNTKYVLYQKVNTNMQLISHE